ncbi:MAG: hypothetical protein EOO27_13065 [Comamonadaceae bacterium]|nr:MAG: hypothetical protein EOO27_13065 [Comamonadaceae bacterium]
MPSARWQSPTRWHWWWRDDRPLDHRAGPALMAAQDRLAAGDDTGVMQGKIAVARFYADHILTCVLRDSIVAGSEAIADMSLEAF